jgi:hypothetical protein
MSNDGMSFANPQEADWGCLHGEPLHPELVEGRTMKASHRRCCGASWFDKLTMKRSFRQAVSNA